MQNLELSFASKESSLSVRSFSVEQRLASLFEIAVVAVSPNDDLDLDALVGQGATLRIGGEGTGARAWTGICSHLEQVEAETNGLSTYYLRIVPELWRTTRRKNSRIFQHLTIPEIAKAVLAEWELTPVLLLDPASFPRFEYRVQYAETDFAFLSRLLEEAGITYAFRDPGPATDDDPDPKTTLLLTTDLHRDEERPAGSLLYFGGKGSPPPGTQVVMSVKLAQEVRAGKLTLRDYDFRSRPDFQLIAQARAMSALEERLEIYEYAPGSFLAEPEGGAAKVDEKEAKSLVARQLAAQRQGRKALSFRTNVLDLAPGVVFTIHAHPRLDVDNKRLLVVRETLEGTQDGEWSISGQAVYAEEAFRPALATPRPRIAGVQSALVVGAEGEEIHTDEHGRVRVQFHWDRYGLRDAQSSCFLRVSQGWAGGARGSFTLPRVGDEVLVGFFEGDPDQPVVVGRVHNSATRAPLALPQQKSRSTWKTESTPGGGGWNELTFEDAKGEELVYLRAERDLERLVQSNEAVTIGGSLVTSIGANEARAIEGDQSLQIAGNRTVQVDGSETISVRDELRLQIGESGTGVAVSKDGRIVLTTGGASIVLDGANIFFDAQSMVQITGGEMVQLSGGEVHVDGQPNVYLNSGKATPPGVIDLQAAFQGFPAINLPWTPEEQVFESLLSSPVEEPDGAPDAIVLPAFVEEQLDAEKDKLQNGIDQLMTAVKDRIDVIKAKALKLKENLIPRIEAARAEAYAKINALRAQLEKIKAEAVARIAELRARIESIRAQVEAKLQTIKDKIMEIRAKAQALIDGIKQKIEDIKAKAKALVDGIKQKIADAKAQAKALFDDLRNAALGILQGVRDDIDAVKGAIQQARDAVKEVVSSIKDAIESVKNEIKQDVAAVKAAINEVKKDIEGVVGEFKELKNDVKQGWNDIKTDAKQAVQEIKDDVKDLKKELKNDVQEIKDDFKNPLSSVKKKDDSFLDQAAKFAKDNGDKGNQGTPDLFQGGKHLGLGSGEPLAKGLNPTSVTPKSVAGGLDLSRAKDTGMGFQNLSDGKPGSLPIQAPHAGGNPFEQALAKGAEGAGLASGAANGGLGAAAASSMAPHGGSGIAQSAIVTRAGGFGGEGMAQAINGTSGATFLQSPNEGQLMVVRTQAALPLTPSDVSAQVVEHQMNGLSSSDAFASVLKQKGYAIYERPWDSGGGEFLLKAVL